LSLNNEQKQLLEEFRQEHLKEESGVEK
jgi:hypothetical protein